MIDRSTNVKAALRSRQRGFLLNPFRFGGGPATDPYFSNVSLLLHMDGANGSTTFSDSGPSPKTVTVSGNAHISTAQSKFGGASGLFDGTGDYLNAPQPSYGTGDLTIEGFIWLSSTNGPTYFDNRASSPAAALVIYTSGGGNTAVTFYAAGADRAVSGALPINTWHHVAVCRASGTSRLFINGVQAGSNYADTNNYNQTSVRLGANYLGNSGVTGHMDEWRVTVGVARYTANFTPPTAAFPNS